MKKTNKFLNIILVTIFVGFIGMSIVYAEEATCEGLLGQSTIDFLNEMFKYLKIIGIVLALALGFIDLGKALLNKEDNSLKSATQTFIKRVIAAIIIFFLPYLLNFLLEFIDGMGEVCVGARVLL